MKKQKQKQKHTTFEVVIRDEDRGDKHFVMADPNGIGIITYTEPEE